MSLTTSCINLKKVTGRSVWYADTVMSDPDFYYYLTDEHVAELLEALSDFKGKNLSPFEVSQNNFILDGLAPVIKKITETLTEGIGVTLIKNFPIDNLSSDDVLTLYLGLGCYVGHLLPQDKENNLLFEIKDNDMSKEQANSKRMSITNQALAFHSDSCDITSLLCINPAKIGGETQLANTLTIHNEILLHNQELLEILYNDFYFTQHDWYFGPSDTFYKLPIYAYYQNKVICMSRRQRISAAQHLVVDVPPLTNVQVAALDLMDSLFQSEKIMLSLQLKRGDILLFNNLMTCHARTAFVDYDEISLKRRLLRLWLAPRISCELPSEFSAIFHSTKAGAVRGGYKQTS